MTGWATMGTATRSAENRQLAVVMFLDMVSYSARMAEEEKNALVCVAVLETILREEVPAFSGRLVKFMGDGSMSCFPTAGLAVNCAMKILGRIQDRNHRFPLRQQFQVRIGLHLGDVVFEKRDLFGDAVNVAARVQPWADPGGIAMTGIVYSQVRNKLSLPGTFLPPVRLKNIPEEIPIFSVAPAGKNVLWWKFRKRRRSIEQVLLVTASILLLGSMGYLRSRLAPDYWTLLEVLSPPDESSRETAATVLQQAEMDFGRIPGVQWLNRESAYGVFRQMGVADPAQALGKLDLAACHAAWKRGINNLVLLRVEPMGQGRWHIQSEIINTPGRVVAASFGAEGPDVPVLVAKLGRETREWIGRHQ